MLSIYGKNLGASAVEIGLFFSVFFLMIVILRLVTGAGLIYRFVLCRRRPGRAGPGG